MLQLESEKEPKQFTPVCDSGAILPENEPGQQHLPSSDTYIVNSTPLLSTKQIETNYLKIKALSNSEYAEELLKPVDDLNRPSAWKLVKDIAHEVQYEEELGPLVLARISLRGSTKANTSSDKNYETNVVVIIQNRAIRNGIWLPEHHRRVESWLAEPSNKDLPVITFIDTPGAAAGDEANLGLQAHSISSLIATFTKLSVPTIGVIYGKAYSGGAIPLAATNKLFALKDALFNTIQPQGLAAIARKEKLSWQECAQRIGITAIELARDGVIDGVINYSPADTCTHTETVKHALLMALKELKRVEDKGVDLREARWHTLKARLKFHEGEQTRETNEAVPALTKSKAATPAPQDNDWQNWLSRCQPIRYHKRIARVWNKVKKAMHHSPLNAETRISVSLNTVDTRLLEHLALELAFECVHQWQGAFNSCLEHYRVHLREHNHTDTPFEQLSDLRELLTLNELKDLVVLQLEYLQILELCYEGFLSELCSVAWEYSRQQNLSLETVSALWESAQLAAGEAGVQPLRIRYFLNWLYFLDQKAVLQPQLQRLNDWKQRQRPRLDTVAFVVAGYYTGTLLCRLFVAQSRGLPFSGAFQPKHIGRQKGFWAKLTNASRNIRIQEQLDAMKPSLNLSINQWTDLLFRKFETRDDALATSDPKQFPGLAERIAQARALKSAPCGLITGTGLPHEANTPVAVFISNQRFQAGAFDMASAEKLCRLLVHAQEQKLPVIGIVSSAGMQTKEGAAALFSMAVANEAINRFSENGGRILIIGYGDCTGGAQASFVTHPRCDTYYLSGANVPFAGQVVVPEHLTLQGTLSNYLFKVTNKTEQANRENPISTAHPTMKGLVRHPGAPDLDSKLRAIDPEIPVANISVSELLESWLVPSTQPLATKRSIETTKIYSPIKTLLVHARGCTALRLVQGAHAYGKQVVLVQSDPDMRSAAVSHLRHQDRLVCLGGQSSEESYLNADSVLRVAQLEQVDALHPGIGFLSESADFAHACHHNKLNFIGPSATSIARMGDKSQAIETATEAGVPTVPGSHGLVNSLTHARSVMDEIGLPLLIKASHGGGGKGIGTVKTRDELDKTFHRVKQEAASAFACADVYIERLVENVRHIEVQVLRDSHGHFRMVGVRDCSTQRSRQKLIEESGEYVISKEQGESLRCWSQQLSETIQYIGAGTVEFLFDLDRNCFYFMEMNTRLQVEHIVTEMTTGIDLVEQQLRIAEGQSIAHIPERIEPNGHAIEVRINAESVSLAHIANKGSTELIVKPAIGKFAEVKFPEPAYSRVLSIAEKGAEVTPFYDNLVAQIVVHGKTRDEALRRMNDMLAECLIEGLDTNLPLLRILLLSEPFQEGRFSTHFVEEWAAAQTKLDILTTTNMTCGESTLFEIDGDEYLLKLPSAGVAWGAASPDQPRFVQVGDIITGDHTILLLEVMKMFMPITLKQLLPDDHAARSYQVKHCRDIEGQYLQKGEVFMSLTRHSHQD